MSGRQAKLAIELTPEQFIRNFGPANCWTGTVGTACVHIRELLLKTVELERENDRLHTYMQQLRRENEALRNDAEHRAGIGVLKEL